VSFTVGVEIVFTKLDDGACEIVVRDRTGPDVRLPARPFTTTIPHDLAQLAVERALGVPNGFWGSTAAGAAFDRFVPVEPSSPAPDGVEVLPRDGEALLAAEMKVDWICRVWDGLTVDGDATDGSRPADDRELAVGLLALDAAANAWTALPDGRSLIETWP
jgi:hypothetical protein